MHITTSRPSTRLPRRLGLWSSIAIVVGITIGSGIFRSPAGVARQVPNAILTLGVWAAGGVITMCGALSLAELATALPESGGFYAFLREGWGRPAAFMFGWAQLLIIRASALGGIALVFGEYLIRLIGVDPETQTAGVRVAAATAIVGAAAVNIVGVRIGAAIVGLSTAAKFTALTALIVASLAFGGQHGASLAHFSWGTAAIGSGGMGLALVAVLWAYDGFGDLSIVAGEVERPETNLPRAIIAGTLAIIVIYVLANAAYLYVMPVEAVGRSSLVAADTMMALYGRTGVALVSAFVMISSFSSLNGVMLASPRIFYAMAADGLFFGAIGRVHGRFQTPYVAIALAGLLGIALVLSRTFEELSSTFVLAVWPFYALSVAAIYRLRRLRPDLPRPYKAVGYPVVPAIFIVSVVYLVVNALVTAPISTGLTFLLILTGAPVYLFAFSRRGRS